MSWISFGIGMLVGAPLGMMAIALISINKEDTRDERT